MPRSAKRNGNERSGAKGRPRQLSLFDDLPPAPQQITASEKPRTVKIRKPRPAPPPERPIVLTPAQAAALLNVRPATLKSWRAKGIGPAFVKRGARLIGYMPEALTAFLRASAPPKP
jgi:hypothetical protein